MYVHVYDKLCICQMYAYVNPNINVYLTCKWGASVWSTVLFFCWNGQSERRVQNWGCGCFHSAWQVIYWDTAVIIVIKIVWSYFTGYFQWTYRNKAPVNHHSRFHVSRNVCHQDVCVVRQNKANYPNSHQNTMPGWVNEVKLKGNAVWKSG